MNQRKPKTAGGKIGRRDFLKTVALTGGMAVGGSLLSSCGSSGAITLDLTQTQYLPLANVGGTIALDANSLDPAGMLVYRSGANSVLVFSRKCTHQGCTIGGFDSGVSTCPCHGSQFDTKGNAVRGPAQRPLQTHTATISGSTVTITG
jgi:nitrite reductase/ring-hydroxylating ferredoxin subunit